MRLVLSLACGLILTSCASDASAPAPTAGASEPAASASPPPHAAAPSIYGDWEYVATSGGKRTTGRFRIARPPAASRFVVDAAGVDSDVTDETLTVDGPRATWRGVVASPGGSTAFDIAATFVGPARMEGENRLRQNEPPHRAAVWTFVATRPVD